MTSTVLQDFRERVEAFLAETGMSIAAFGDLAVNDRSFVSDLRDGNREPRLSTIERVDRFMSEHPRSGKLEPQSSHAGAMRT
jgi:hypothetical protein